MKVRFGISRGNLKCNHVFFFLAFSFYPSLRSEGNGLRLIAHSSNAGFTSL